MDNRQRLLDCALDLFSMSGYHAVGVREIVDAAGVTKPTLYHYFESKRGLLEALMNREAGRLLSAVLVAAVYQGDLVLTLEKITRAYFDSAKQQPSFYRMHLSMYFSPPESVPNQVVHPFALEQRNLLENVFIQAADDHGNLRGRHVRYAAGFLGEINAMIGLYLNENMALTDDLIYQTVHQFMHGIFS